MNDLVKAAQAAIQRVNAEKDNDSRPANQWLEEKNWESVSVLAKFAATWGGSSVSGLAKDILGRKAYSRKEILSSLKALSTAIKEDVNQASKLWSDKLKD